MNLYCKEQKANSNKYNKEYDRIFNKKYCSDCGKELEYAKGMGLVCTNPNCKNIDGSTENLKLMGWWSIKDEVIEKIKEDAN